jgi:hypothetical protein
MIREVMIGLVQIGGCTVCGALAGLSLAWIMDQIKPPQNAEDRMGSAFGWIFSICLFGVIGFTFGVLSLAKGW